MAILYVDLIDACHMRCPTCVRGTRLLPNTSRRIPIELFERIVRKARDEGYDAVGLYNWTEPFLNQQIPRYVGIVKQVGMKCDVSTTLSFRGRLPLVQDALRAGLDTLIVSVSGFTQEVHQVNHRGGNLVLVKENLQQISGFLASERLKTRVVLRFLRFGHNQTDEALLADHATGLGFAFEPLEGAGSVDNPISNYAHPESYEKRLKAYDSKRPREELGEVCTLIMDTLAVDAQGIASLCCANPNYPPLEIGPYLDLTATEILLKRYMHPICGTCRFPRRMATERDRTRLVAALSRRLGGLGSDELASRPAAIAGDTILRRLRARVRALLGRAPAS